MNEDFIKPDYDKVSVEFNKIYGTNCASHYLSRIDRCTVKCIGVEAKLKELIYIDGKVKKEFEAVDYKKLAVAVSKKIGKSVSTCYVKFVHKGHYKSSKVLKAIEELL
jgi:hypothetical protein